MRSIDTIVFQHGSRRRSAPQVSDLIDTDGVTRARLFTRKAKIRVVGHRPRRIDTLTRLPSSRNRTRQFAFLSCTRRVATGRNREDGRGLFCRFLTATATHRYAWRLTCSWRVHATYLYRRSLHVPAEVEDPYGAKGNKVHLTRKARTDPFCTVFAPDSAYHSQNDSSPCDVRRSASQAFATSIIGARLDR